MTGGTNAAGRLADAEEAYAAVPLPGIADAPMPSDLPPPEGIEPTPTWRLALPWIASLVSVLWIAGIAALSWGDPALADPVRLVEFIAALCAVPALLGITWLVAARADGSHASRLLETSRELRAETLALGDTVAALAATMATNRATLTEHARALSALGDSATSRLGAIGDGLSREIAEADRHARALGEAAAAAEAKVAAMLATVPRARAEAEALGEAVEQAGVTAGVQMAALDAQLAALAERGRETEAVAGGAAQKLAAHVARMEGTTEAAGQRLDAVAAAVAADIDALLDRTASAVDESRKGIAAQGEAMLAMVSANQATLDSAARDSAEALAQRIELVELVIDRVAQRLEAQRGAGEEMVAQLDTWLAGAERRFDTMERDGVRRTEALAAAIAALGGHAEGMTRALKDGEGAALTATATIETLLIALDSAAREMDETLPASLGRLDDRLQRTRTLIGGAQPDLLALVAAAESTHEAIEAVADAVERQRRDAEAVATTLATGLADAQARSIALDGSIEGTIARVENFAEEAAPRLLEALLRVRETAAAAADRARDTLATVIPEAAGALEEAGGAALARAAAATVEARLAAIAQAADAAVEATRRAGARLDEQLARIDAQSRDMDARFAEARAAQEEREGESFARRAALLVEALNSVAIDLSQDLGADVPDAAWAAYLKGDRGVFTRRAVRLLDTGQARDIARLYDEEAGFRDRVNRYIHDFEAMLRAILSQRDGSPLGVTLLSSDMGKLYVALAQAIERLR